MKQNLFRFFIPAGIFLLFLNNNVCHAQGSAERPKLVIGIVVDQMRYDFIPRYWDKYENNGFRKLINEGFFCENTHYNYVPTYTGPGHASVYTGTTPSGHGICANDWYDKELKKEINCVYDPDHYAVGTEAKENISPVSLKAATVGDMLKLASNFRSKVISVGIKDRGAVLPGGHLADAAYWLDDKRGSWISSDYYIKSLPEWVVKFNREKWVEKYLDQQWETLLPLEEYTESIADDNPYERQLDKNKRPVFPYDLPKLKKEGWGLGLIRYTPWGNTLTAKMALAAIDGEQLGKSGSTDMLLVSFSPTDYIGHGFGPRSVEVEDTYLRLDRELAAFLEQVEAKVGRENVLIFLTSDHGVVDVPAFLKDHRFPAGYYQSEVVMDSLNARLKRAVDADSIVMAFTNNQVYLNNRKLQRLGRKSQRAQHIIVNYLKAQPFAKDVVSLKEMMIADAGGEEELQMVKKGYYRERSGDIVVIPNPGWIDSKSEQGTTHGSGYTYDTHVPLIWYGWKVKPGKSSQRVNITDIAPTLSGLLNITAPDAATGKVIPLSLE